jgi:dihydrolipoamide dehydrogenase
VFSHYIEVEVCMNKENTYDVVVLGGGAGGVPAAIRAAQLGGKVAVIEGRRLGGQCMNLGCIPLGQKMVATHILKNLTLGREMGLSGPDIKIDHAALLTRQEELIGFMRQGVMSTLKKKNVTVIEGRGRITGKGTLEIKGERLSYEKIILATGAEWHKPTFPGADLDGVVNTDLLLTAQKLPQRVLLFGESPWLIEISQFLTSFGSQVTLATPQKGILAGGSKAIVTRFRSVLKDEGIAIKNMAAIEKVAKKNDELMVDVSTKEGHEKVVVDTVVTFDRAAALKDLGLENIDLDEEQPFLEVNEKTETGAESVYAIGDLTAPPEGHYSHRAAAMGIVAAENAMGDSATLNPKIHTRVLFTYPEVASVGLTPKEAKGKGYEVVVGSAPLSMNPLGMILAENEGIVEVVADKTYGEILGVHIIGRNASEMIGQALVAIQLEATFDELAAIPFPHPTFSESLTEAVRDALGNPIYLP